MTAVLHVYCHSYPALLSLSELSGVCSDSTLLGGETIQCYR